MTACARGTLRRTCALSSLKTWWLLGCSIVCGAWLAVAEVSLRSTVSQSTIYLGESFQLAVEVQGAESQIEAPDMAALQTATVELVDQRSSSQSRISIINGRRSSHNLVSRTFVYRVTPQRAGTFVAGPIQVQVAGHSYTTSGARVQVRAMETQELVLVSLQVPTNALLIEAPFTLEVQVAIAALAEPYQQNEPLLPQHPPRISADFLELNHQIAGLKGPDLNALLNNLIAREETQPPFYINNYQARSGVFSFFNEAQPMRFRLPPQIVTINDKSYWLYRLALEYIPLQEGTFTFNPVVFKGRVIAGVDAERRTIPREIYTASEAMTVEVRPPPASGRPAWFVGTVGQDIQAIAEFDTNVCKVGDPLTLTLDITGKISVANLRAPQLSQQSALTRDFRIYDDNVKSETLPNGKRFKYRVRPTTEGTLEFPPIKIGYFDVLTHSYRTVTTAPLPLQARATTQIATAGGRPGEPTTGELLGREQLLPAGITLDAQAIVPLDPWPPRRILWSVLLLPPLLVGGLRLITPAMRWVRRGRAYQCQAGAIGRAQRALARCTDAAGAMQIFRRCLSERFQVAGTNLTPAEIVALLQARGVATTTTVEIQRLLGALEAAQYQAGDAAPVSATINALRECLSAL